MTEPRGRPSREQPTARNIPGGIVHTYQHYDPQRFPPPSGPVGPDLASAAMEHMMMFGDRRQLSEEDLANAVRIDPSQIAGLGPSLDALIALLEERRRKILETYETDSVRAEAGERYRDASQSLNPPKQLREDIRKALQRAQIPELERLWYASERRDPEFSAELLGVLDRLGDRFEIDELAARWDFTGREPMSVEQGLEIKQQLETIEKLLEQLREAKKNAKIGIVDLDALREFVEEADIEQLNRMGQQIQEIIKQQAEEQGLQRDAQGNYSLTPKAHRVFQAKLLDEIFNNLEAGRAGRHTGPIEGEGVVELPKTRPYEFGDAASNIDLTQTMINAAARGNQSGRGVRISTEDIEINRTRNNPKCATCLLVDMSGSMGQMGQYIQTKRMAMAMDGLLRSEYPGDFLRTIEIASFARTVPPGEIISLMPKPVTIRDPVVRMRVDMADPEVSESMIHPHFTNIQHGLSLARRHLANVDTPNKQVILFTDGLPTAHFENGPDTGIKRGKQTGNENFLYLLYPPDPLTERATMREAMACAREGITINVFLLPSWSQDEDDIAFAQRLAEQTKGRMVFVGGEDLDRFVLWDYVNQRRSIIA
ncbi:MAG: vWA domain-containing protein [Phycisphaerales bacterium]